MLKSMLAAALAFPLIFSTPTFAQENEPSHSDAILDAVLDSDIRKEDRVRDKYRHPVETLKFFQVEPDMIVGVYTGGRLVHAYPCSLSRRRRKIYCCRSRPQFI